MLSKIFFIFLLTHVQSQSFKFQCIGIFSICGEQYIDNEFTRESYLANQTAYKSFEIDFEENYVEYKSFDVCFDRNTLTSLVASLLLDSEFNTKEFEYYDVVDIFGYVTASLAAPITTKIISILTYIQ